MNRSEMVAFSRLVSIVLTTWLALPFVFGSSCSSALGQDIIIDEEVMIQVAPNGFVVQDANFDQWVYGNATKGLPIRQKLESILLLNVAELDRACKLTDSQKKKLILAGHGDIKHFFDQVAEARRVFDRLKHDQTNINTIFAETQPLSANLRTGLFGADSIFARMIPSTLDANQAEVYRKSLLDKAVYRHRANASLLIANLDHAIGLNSDQRRRLLDLIIEETTPSSKPAGQYETNILILKMARIPETKIRGILDDTQWVGLQTQIRQAEATRTFLKANGFLEEDGPHHQPSSTSTR